MSLEIPGLSKFSRHQYCEMNVDDEERLYLDDRKPFRYGDYEDTVTHLVTSGQTLFNLAGFYYSRIERAAGLWWIIADFQPTPIHDPTVQLAPGQLIYIPSLRTVMTEIFVASRQAETVL